VQLELKEEQKKALKFILDVPRSGLFVGTGCGKTVITQLYLKILDEPALIIMPAYIRDHQIWEKENDKFNLGLDLSTNWNMPGKILMVSYEHAKANPEILDDYEVVILEEAHCIADTSTIRFKNLHTRIKKKKRVVLLSGYPVENHLKEIFVVSLITNVLGYNYKKFLLEYFNIVEKNRRVIKATPKRGAVNKIIQLIKPFVFVANKDLFFDTPVKKENLVIRYELSDYQKNLINELSENYKYTDERLHVSCKNDLVVFGKVMQIVSGFVYETDNQKELNPVFFDENPKRDKLLEVLNGKTNFLLWYLFDAEAPMVKEFGDRCRLSKLQTDSRGLNLQEYKFSMYYTLPLSGGQFLQSVDRLYRIGRTEDVVSVVLLPNGVFGDKMFKMTEGKHKLTGKFIKDLLRVRIV